MFDVAGVGDRMSGPVAQRRTRRRNKRWIDKVHVPGAPKPAAPGQPPRAGKGSSLAAWLEYAKSIGLEVPAKATRAEIFVLVDEGPSIDSEWHPLARDWYRSLAESGQSIFYEPSDWQTARVLAELLSRALKAGKVTASLIERWQIGATELLTTEGARRRVRLELEHPAPEGEEGDDNVTYLDQFRAGLG